MSFEDNPMMEDQDAADKFLMLNEIKALQSTIAAQAAAIACAEGIHQQMTSELAAQAAEIERLKNRVHSENRSVFELNEKLHESRRIESAQAHGIELLRDELAALRSQLKEQRAKLDGARKFVFNTSQGAIVVEPMCSKWRCYRDTMDWTAWENLIDPESNSMTFATLDKLFAALYAANWLTPHAEIEST